MKTAPGALDQGGTGLCGARYEKGVCLLMVWQRKEPGSDSPFKDTSYFQWWNDLPLGYASERFHNLPYPN